MGNDDHDADEKLEGTVGGGDSDADETEERTRAERSLRALRGGARAGA
jgi:hypothetical protein